MQKLDLESFYLRFDTDSYFATNYDSSSQLGCIVLLCDKYINLNILHYISRNSKRVARSVLGAGTYAFVDAFDFAFCPKIELEELLDKI